MRAPTIPFDRLHRRRHGVPQADTNRRRQVGLERHELPVDIDRAVTRHGVFRHEARRACAHFMVDCHALVGADRKFAHLIAAVHREPRPLLRDRAVGGVVVRLGPDEIGLATLGQYTPARRVARDQSGLAIDDQFRAVRRHGDAVGALRHRYLTAGRHGHGGSVGQGELLPPDDIIGWNRMDRAILGVGADGQEIFRPGSRVNWGRAPPSAPARPPWSARAAVRSSPRRRSSRPPSRR